MRAAAVGGEGHHIDEDLEIWSFWGILRDGGELGERDEREMEEIDEEKREEMWTRVPKIAKKRYSEL